MKGSLKNKHVIDKLFNEGKKRVIYPFLIIELESDYKGYLVTVSKKKFKRAVDRNRIKRLIRTRLNKPADKAIGIVYLSDKMPDSNILNLLFNI